ncbi:Spy/CpxP family protein refolding chaperone [Anatilimnocola floriformis]|uniref:Spy/CpxP family protein refolding chaperone n=1 Tax=Anatilimnocola floriformis TaxID=2948575 RepID=UPI0020C57D13|nr:Spy/CpxP family protein refolding chaperone [Anatilimnocola floriformis]
MSNSFRMLCLAGLAALVVVGSLNAQEQKKRPGGGGPGGFGMRSPTQLPESVKLTDDQKAKLADIEKKYADKVKAAADKSKLTEEQSAKQREAMGKFRDSGKSFAEFQEEVAKSLNLTDDQKKGREEATALRAEITKEVEALLTDEQKTALKAAREQRGRPGGKGGDRKKND